MSWIEEMGRQFGPGDWVPAQLGGIRHFVQIEGKKTPTWPVEVEPGWVETACGLRFTLQAILGVAITGHVECIACQRARDEAA